jgi:hypothetical protein
MSGEHPNGRKAIDDLTRRLVESGVKPSDAEKRAKEAARRNDRENNR